MLQKELHKLEALMMNCGMETGASLAITVNVESLRQSGEGLAIWIDAQCQTSLSHVDDQAGALAGNLLACPAKRVSGGGGNVWWREELKVRNVGIVAEDILEMATGSAQTQAV